MIFNLNRVINIGTMGPINYSKNLDTKKPAKQRALELLFGTEGETRTLTLLKAEDFESSVSTIPPLRQVEVLILDFFETLSRFF